VRAIYFDGTDTRYREDYPQPVRGDDEALIRVTLAALCNTDREMVRGYMPGFTGVLGHEFVGIVEDAADNAWIGKRVVGEINLSCFEPECLYCATGRDHHCLSRTTLGIWSKDGCFADYVTLPTRLLHEVPDLLRDEEAIFAEPLAAAFRIIEQESIKESVLDAQGMQPRAGTVETGTDSDVTNQRTSQRMPVALVGDGRLAFLIGQVIASTGVALTVFGLSADKLKMFAPFADTVIADEVNLAAGREGFEVVIDATGSPESLATSVALTRSEGLLVMKSTYADVAQIDMSEVVVRELTIQGSRCGPFEPALRMLAEKRITLPPVEAFAPADFEEAFASRAFKVTLDFS